MTDRSLPTMSRRSSWRHGAGDCARFRAAAGDRAREPDATVHLAWFGRLRGGDLYWENRAGARERRALQRRYRRGGAGAPCPPADRLRRPVLGAEFPRHLLSSGSRPFGRRRGARNVLWPIAVRGRRAPDWLRAVPYRLQCPRSPGARWWHGSSRSRVRSSSANSAKNGRARFVGRSFCLTCDCVSSRPIEKSSRPV